MMTEALEQELERVIDKFSAGWQPDLLFSDWDVRVVLRYTESVVRSYDRLNKLASFFNEKFGADNWLMFVNNMQGEDELYLKDIGQLFLWKLQDTQGMKEVIETIYVFEGIK
jgi:hypothetical protein